MDIDKDIDIAKCTPNTRVALRADSYMLHKILPTKVDPLVSLMKVEKVPDATYDMVGGLDKQILEIKEVIELPIKHPELFDALGVAQPKVRARVAMPPPLLLRRRCIAVLTHHDSDTAAHASCSPTVSPRLHPFLPLRLSRAGRAHVRPARHRQDAAGPRRGPPHGLHLHSRVRR